MLGANVVLNRIDGLFLICYFCGHHSLVSNVVVVGVWVLFVFLLQLLLRSPYFLDLPTTSLLLSQI